MINVFKTISLLILFNSCQPSGEISNYNSSSQELRISYTGDADVVQFKMFEGLHAILTEDSITNTFEAILKIPQLHESFFTYDLIVHKKDSLGKMIKLEPDAKKIKLNQKAAVTERSRFVWDPQNRNTNFLKNDVIVGSLKTDTLKSEYLQAERQLTIYTPKEVSSDMPHIYFTDGSVVKFYTPYVDRLISMNIRVPLLTSENRPIAFCA